MKKSIIYLGLALVTIFQNANAETALVSGVAADANFAAAVKAEQYQKSLLEDTIAEHKTIAPVEDTTILNPETVLIVGSQKTPQEIIAEDQKITESHIANDGILFFSEKTNEEIIEADNQIIDSKIVNEVQPVFIEKSIEDKIADDNSIIEGNIPVEAQLLDFKKINSSSILVKQFNNKEIIGMN